MINHVTESSRLPLEVYSGPQLIKNVELVLPKTSKFSFTILLASSLTFQIIWYWEKHWGKLKDILNQKLFFSNTTIQFQTEQDLGSVVGKSNVTLLQKTFWPLLLEIFMNKPGNKTHVESWAFSQWWTETKSCRCYLSYQLPVTLQMMRYCWPTACLGKSWENCTKRAILDPSSRSHKAPDRQLLLLSLSLDMKNATGLNSSNTPI